MKSGHFCRKIQFGLLFGEFGGANTKVRGEVLGKICGVFVAKHFGHHSYEFALAEHFHRATHSQYMQPLVRCCLVFIGKIATQLPLGLGNGSETFPRRLAQFENTKPQHLSSFSDRLYAESMCLNWGGILPCGTEAENVERSREFLFGLRSPTGVLSVGNVRRNRAKRPPQPTSPNRSVGIKTMSQNRAALLMAH